MEWKCLFLLAVFKQLTGAFRMIHRLKVVRVLSSGLQLIRFTMRSLSRLRLHIT